MAMGGGMDVATRKRMIGMYESGMPTPEIASQLKMRVGSVRQALTRARQRGELTVMRKPPKGAKGVKVAKPVVSKARKARKAPHTPHPAHEDKRVMLSLHPETRRTLKLLAVDRDLTMSEIVTEAIGLYSAQRPVHMP